RGLVGHRVIDRVERRQKPDSVFLYKPVRLHAGLVPREAHLGREPRHADVHARLLRVVVGIRLLELPLVEDAPPELHDVDVVAVRLLLLPLLQPSSSGAPPPIALMSSCFTLSTLKRSTLPRIVRIRSSSSGGSFMNRSGLQRATTKVFRYGLLKPFAFSRSTTSMTF